MAREAGASLRDAFASLGSLEVSTKSTATDLVSDADVATERLIRARLRDARPGDAILGEEGGEGEGTTGLRWVVDPLDGTVNFLFGIPQWAVSIACEDADGALAGVVYDAVRDEMFSARRDGPATLNGTPLHGSGRTELATAMVGDRLRLRRRRARGAGGDGRRACCRTCATSGASAPPRSTSCGARRGATTRSTSAG